MTILEFLEELERNPDLAERFRSKDPAISRGVCEELGLNTRQCNVVRSGDLQRIRHAIELESGSTKGLYLKVVM